MLLLLLLLPMLLPLVPQQRRLLQVLLPRFKLNVALLRLLFLEVMLRVLMRLLLVRH